MKKFISLIILLGGLNTIMSQTIALDLAGTSGDSFKNTTYELDWSVGECVIETVTGRNYMLTQGFHQSNYEITAIKTVEQNVIDVSLYPNPVPDLIHLRINNKNSSGCKYRLTDGLGKTLQTGLVDQTEENIDFSNYKPGTYFLIVNQNNQIIKSLQIIKK